MNIFSNIFTPKKKGPPTNMLNETDIHFNVTDDNEDYESPKKKPRTETNDYSQMNTDTDYSNQLFSRAKQGNKFSKANLNMGVGLAKKGLLPNTPENQHIFQEMNRRAQQDYLTREQQRQEDLEKLQKEHSENIAEKRRQEELLKQQQQQAEQERQRKQQEEEQERQRQEQERQEQQRQEQERQEQEFQAQQERMRKEYEEQERIWKEQRDRIFQQREQERQAEEERLRQEQERQRQQQEQERQRQQQEQERQRQQQQQEQQQQQQQFPKTELPEGVIDMDLCPAYKAELPKFKQECNKNIYRKLSLKMHPDKNQGCIPLATEKFKKLGIICGGNQFLGGSKKKTKKYFKKKSNFKISKKHKGKKSKKSKRNVKKTKRVRSK